MITDQIFQSIIASSAIEDAGISPENWVATGAVDTVLGRPFGVVKMGLSAPTLVPRSNVMSQELDLWVYDEPADYERINRILRAARGVMLNLESKGNPSGWFLGVRWNGDSAYLKDPDYDAIVRYASFTVVVSGL